jgi:branched-chain amino acid transport system substrate-binding protein
MTMTRREFVIGGGAALAAGGAAPAYAADVPGRIRIGYAISLSGPFATGAGVTTLPNYRLWVRDVNARGGVMVGRDGRRLPVEAVEYDDGSSQEAAIRLTEKLMSDDRVDFVLPPWGTGINLAVAPVYRRHGYPQLASTAIANGLPGLVRQLPTIFFFLAEAADYVTGLIGILSRLKAAGKINNKIAMLSVSDQFGTELAAAADSGFAEAGFEIVLDRTYPIDVTDLRQELQEAQASGADTFASFSYPPDTFLVTATAEAIGYNPMIFYTAIGTAFPAYGKKFAGRTNGILGNGGWDTGAPAAKHYFRRFLEASGQEPDRWACPAVYVSLECLEQAIAAAESLDRGKVIAALRSKVFNTVVGAVDLRKQIRGKQFLVGQWQDGEFFGVEPADLPGARDLVFPKPRWPG